MRILRNEYGDIFKANIVNSVPEGYEDITDIIGNLVDNVEFQYLEAIEVSEVAEVVAVDAIAAKDGVAYVAPVAYKAAIAYVAPAAAIEAADAIAEHWTDGVDTVYNVNDIPTLADENGSAYLDPNYAHVDAVAAIEAVAAVEEVLAEDEVLEVLEVQYEAAIEAADAIVGVKGVARHFNIQTKSTGDRDRRNAILDKLRTLREPLLVAADIEVNKIEDVSGDSTAMRAYRQELRDVLQTYIKVDGDPKVSTDTIDLDTFTWPIKP